MDWKKIIKMETEKSVITTFYNSNGRLYPYVILPFESRITQKFRDAVIEGLSFMLKKELKKANVILAIEAKGFFPATLIAQKFKKDLVVVRKRDYKIASQLKINQEKAYGEGTLYCVGLKKTDKILIIEDMISSGGTLINIIKKLKDYKIIGVASVYERGEGVEIIEKKTGIKPKTLVRLEIVKDKPYVSKFYQ
jgi:adenine phosphoribosyltransferase